MKKSRSNRSLVLAGSILWLITLCFHTNAASGDVDLSFDPGSGVNGHVTSAVLQPDGRIIIGGGFRMVKGLIRRGIARLNADGSGDSTFVHPGPNSGIDGVGPVVLQPDGKVLVGYADGIRRLNSDGTIDPTFNLPQIEDVLGFNVAIGGIMLQPDGKILISGGFSFVYDTNIQGLARLNPDGTLDSSFATGFGLSIDSVVSSIVLQGDGKILIGGRFPGFDATARPNLVRLEANGSVDETFATGLSQNGSIDAVVVQPDGKVLIGGAFNTLHGTNRSSIARLNADGSLDESFDPGTGLNGGEIHTMALQPDGRVLIGGHFLEVNGTSRNRLARLNANGTVDVSFDAGGIFLPGTGAGERPEPVDMVVQPDGKVIVASVDTIGTRADYYLLIRLNSDGSRDTTFEAGGGLNGGVRTLVVLPDGKIAISGFFEFIDGINTRGVARLNANGTLDRSFSLDVNADGGFYLIARQPDGKFVVAGYPTFINGVNTLHGGIARLEADGGIDSSFDPGSGLDGGQAYATALQADGKILIAGRFDSVNGVPRLDLVRLNTNGSVDTSFNLRKSPTGGAIEAVVPLADGRILVGGTMQLEGGNETFALIRVNSDGSRDSTFNFPRAGSVSSISLSKDGKALVSGAFYNPGQEAFPDWIARINGDGSIDSTFQPDFAFRSETLDDDGITDAHSTVLQPDGKIFVAGEYFLGKDNGGNDSYYRGIFRLNSDGGVDSTFSPGPAPNQRVNAIGLQVDGNVVIGGQFPEYDDVVRPFIARLHGNNTAGLPLLSLVSSHESLTLSWPVSTMKLELHESTNLSASSWLKVSTASVTNDGQISVTVPTATAGSQFFQLKSD